VTALPSLEKFTQRDEDGALYTASLQIVLYANKPLAELAEGATACYRLFLDRFGDSMNWYLAEQMRKARRFAPKYVEVFPTLCRQRDAGLPLYRVYLQKISGGLLISPSLCIATDGWKELQTGSHQYTRTRKIQFVTCIHVML
jgi:hypothetical protein